MLGGGCQAVGVTGCATGFVSDGEGGCDPVLPSEPCPAGTMEVIGQTECQPVGVTECATGFMSDGEGGCDPILPLNPCPFGSIQVLGETDCQPLGDCGQGTWGNIPTDGTTVFVDQTADATGADGSQSNPFITINDALTVVASGGQIAIAAGEYAERVVLSRQVRLSGRCAELVTIRGVRYLGVDRPAILVNPGGDGSTLLSLTLTGDAEGLSVSGTTAVTVEEAQVWETGGEGVFLDNRASATLTRVRVERATKTGVFSWGNGLQMDECVVRGTRPLPDLTMGMGINCVCWPLPANCGAVHISRSLVEGNNYGGIGLGGVPTTIEASVVRDTRPHQFDRWFGRGIDAQCYPDMVSCPPLLVSGSVVASNRDVGINVRGIDVTIIDTVVRDTMHQQAMGVAGRGINADCDPDLDVCGSITVSRSLVAGNREMGIFALGVDADIEGTIVRDTQSQHSDGMSGRGIACECDPVLNVCGRLTVSDSLSASNRELGIRTMGVEGVIRRSVVRDTQVQEGDQRLGIGIRADCQIPIGECGSVHISRSLVANNIDVGISIRGASASIEASVVKDTRPTELEGFFGRGIDAVCDELVGQCGVLEVSRSVIISNRAQGIAAIGPETSVSETVIKDTLPWESDDTVGRGISVQCDAFTGFCGSLAVSNTLISGNRDGGIVAIGSETAIQGTVVRDTLPQVSDGKFGTGIVTQCYPAVGAYGGLTVSSSLVERNCSAGLASVGAHTTLSGVTVRDTFPNESGEWARDYGQGIFAYCYPSRDLCPVLQVTNCVVESNYSAGVAIQGGSGSIHGSLIRNVLPRPLDDGYGYGLQVEGLSSLDAPQTWFYVESCQILDAGLAGIVYIHASGTVSTSHVSGGDFSIAMNIGSELTVTEDNQLSGNFEDEPSWQNIEPSPAPEPMLPMEVSQ